MTPKRIQLSRKKGYRKPEGAIVVARPTRWGNPYRPVRLDNGSWVAEDDNGERYFGYGPVPPGSWPTREAALRDCVRLFDEVEVQMLAIQGVDFTELAGHDLACWCPLDQPCHGDVLLEIANGGAS